MVIPYAITPKRGFNMTQIIKRIITGDRGLFSPNYAHKRKPSILTFPQPLIELPHQEFFDNIVWESDIRNRRTANINPKIINTENHPDRDIARLKFGFYFGYDNYENPVLVFTPMDWNKELHEKRVDFVIESGAKRLWDIPRTLPESYNKCETSLYWFLKETQSSYSMLISDAQKDLERCNYGQPINDRDKLVIELYNVCGFMSERLRYFDNVCKNDWQWKILVENDSIYKGYCQRKSELKSLLG